MCLCCSRLSSSWFVAYARWNVDDEGCVFVCLLCSSRRGYVYVTIVCVDLKFYGDFKVRQGYTEIHSGDLKPKPETQALRSGSSVSSVSVSHAVFTSTVFVEDAARFISTSSRSGKASSFVAFLIRRIRVCAARYSLCLPTRLTAGS